MADEMMGAFAAFRRQLESHVSLTEEQIRSAWSLTLRMLQRDIAIWTDKYSAKLKQVREESGNPKAQVPLSWLYDTYGGDWKSIQRSVTAEIGAFGDQALHHIQHGQGLAALLGSDAARGLLISALRPVSHRVNPQALIETTRNEARQALVGRSISGKHLPTLLKGLGEDAANRVHKGLLAALSTGENPRTAAGLLHHALGDSFNRALTVARTEMVGAYRDAQIMNYQRNSDVVGQWMWSAAKQGRTCFQCIWMDGSLHDLSETFDSHPCCRCSPVPVTKGWDEILGPLGIDSSDIPDTRVTANYESGQDWFNRQSEQMQRHMLGPAAFSAWQEGDLKLGDLVGQHDDGQWYQKSLREIGINARDYLGARPERYVPEPEPEPEAEAAPEHAPEEPAGVDARKVSETIARGEFNDRALANALKKDPDFQELLKKAAQRSVEFSPRMMVELLSETGWAPRDISPNPVTVALHKAYNDVFGIDEPLNYSKRLLKDANADWGSSMAGLRAFWREAANLVGEHPATLEERGKTTKAGAVDERIHYVDKAAATAAANVFGEGVSGSDLAAVVGAQPGDTVHVEATESDAISMTVKGDHYESTFQFSRTDEGIVAEGDVQTEAGYRTAQTGNEILVAMEKMREMGVSRLEADASREETSNGYITWARLGFTGDIPISVLGAAQARFGNITTVQDLMAQPGGSAWWREHGVTWHATFDFTDPAAVARLQRFIDRINRQSSGDALRSEAARMRDTFKDDYFRNSEDFEAQATADAAFHHMQDMVAQHGGGSPEADAAYRAWEDAQAKADMVRQQSGSLHDSYSEAALHDAFGRSLSDDEVRSLVGAPEDAEVTVEADPHQMQNLSFGQKDVAMARFQMEGPDSDYSATRILWRRPDGTLYMENENIKIAKRLQGSGLGLRIFSDQVDSLVTQNVAYIKTFAASAGDLNGYYTWARFGYLGRIPDELLADAQAKFGKVTTIQQLMRTQNGRNWWKANGIGWGGTFDLRDGSLSRKILDAYKAEKGWS